MDRTGGRGCLWTSVVVGSFVAWSASQASGQTANAPAGPVAATKVYEPGDIYLPGSRVYVFVGKTGLGHEHAVVGGLAQGKLELETPQESGQLVFDMRTFTADTEAARKYIGLAGVTDSSTQEQVTANMLGAAVLDVARHPTATFTIHRVVPIPQPSSRGLPQYQLLGDFSLRGVAQPIQVIADAEEKNGWIHLRGGFAMRQTQFGITPFSKAFGALGVTDQLNVYGDLWLAKQRQVAALAAPDH